MKQAKPKIILMGGAYLFAAIAKKLSKSGLEVRCVLSHRHANEKIAQIHHATLREFLDSLKMDYVISEDINTDKKIAEMIDANTMGVSIGGAWIFKKEFIYLFKGRFVNLHGTRLPQDRGGGGFSWRILRNDKLGFAVIHKVDPGVDTGDILKYKEYFYPESCRKPIDYEDYSTNMYLGLFDEFIADVAAGREMKPVAQSEYFSTYWPRVSTDLHGYIDWSWNLEDIERFICAFDDHYRGASTFVNGKKVRLKDAFISKSDGTFHPFQKGIIYRISAGAYFIATEGGTLVVRRIIVDSAEKGRENEMQIRVGDRLHTPLEYLEEAKTTRAIYTPQGLKLQ